MRKEKTVDFHIKWAWHAITKLYNSYSGQYDLTMAIGYVLLNIDSENGTPATKIGPSIGMEPRSLTRTLKTLEEKGWIRRETDSVDKRFVKVFLTDEGKAKRRFARDGVITFNKYIQSEIPAEKLAVFFDVLKQINNLVEEQNSTIRENANLEESIF